MKNKKNIFIILIISLSVISLMVSPFLRFELERIKSQQSDELYRSMDSLYSTVETHINTLEQINDLGKYDYSSIQPFLYNSLDAIKNHQMTTLVIYSNKNERKAVEAYKDEFNQLWNVLNEVHNEKNNSIKNLDSHIKKLKNELADFESYNPDRE